MEFMRAYDQRKKLIKRVTNSTGGRMVQSLSSCSCFLPSPSNLSLILHGIVIIFVCGDYFSFSFPVFYFYFFICLVKEARVVEQGKLTGVVEAGHGNVFSTVVLWFIL